MGAKDKLARANKGTAPIKKKLTIDEQVAVVEKEVYKKSADNASYKDIPLEKIKFNDANEIYRSLDNTQSIEVLKSDIKLNGLMHNLVVSMHRGKTLNDDYYVLISGERRYRAIQMLHEEEDGNGIGAWGKVKCRVLSNLSERQEIIQLDAANLQVRGGVGDETVTRKAVVRHLDNLMAEYGTSVSAAKMLIEKYSSLSTRTIERAVKIEKQMDPALIQLIDNNKISKKFADTLIRLSSNEQKQAGENLHALDEAGVSAGKWDEALAYVQAIAAETTAQLREKKTDELKAFCEETLKRIKEEKNQDQTSSTQKQVNTQAVNKAKSASYIQKINPTITRLRKISASKRQIKHIQGFGEDDKFAIISSLDELIEAATELKRELSE